MEWFEDMETGTVKSFGSYPVTREEVLDFARKYDPQPFHLDDEAAAQTHFRRLAASGWHTCAMTMAMIVRYQDECGHQGLGSPGIDELRFLKPVYPGDTLTCEREVLEKRVSASKPGMGIFRTRVRTLNQHGEPVLSYVANAFVRTRPD
ncbi:MaoC family dehydratase [Novosphingobium sp. TH158]|uniref:MaoC family dehydratase n=1 Tax=Novosphingobium sp. TH158 TaxID=2067455 RepID=UPI000C7AFD2A|nr:MaoC family dehydratase [Novosphingobium sp. TH158]PLK25938.1 acyl dehydratase [Novosphingobium sp. TH158]